MLARSSLIKRPKILVGYLSAILLIWVTLGSYPLGLSRASDVAEDRFEHSYVDKIGLHDPWGKSFGDINGDGLPDIIIGAHKPAKRTIWQRLLIKLKFKDTDDFGKGELVWYANPGWEKHLVSDRDRFRTDIEVADIDGDGRNDIIALGDTGMAWFKNPEWSRMVIDPRKLHDLEIADLDADGDIDIVARNQSLFNYDNGNELHFYRQDSLTQWERFSIVVPHGEGLKIADMDADGKLDIVVSLFWFKNPGHLDSSEGWEPQLYITKNSNYDLADVFIDTADIDGDGAMDVVLAPAESKGNRYRISWIKGPENIDGSWKEVVVDPDVEAVHHSIHAEDFDNDGDIDLLTAEMGHGDKPNEVKMYWNLSAGFAWKKQVVSSTGSHSMRAVDIDLDGDIDFFGADVFGRNRPVELWKNRTYAGSLSNWKRHEIDSDAPWRSVFIQAADLDGDGYRDVVAGGWWYSNPGKANGHWPRRPVGKWANNAAIVDDFDGDGDIDILASVWKDTEKPNLLARLIQKFRGNTTQTTKLAGRLVWAQNEGRGDFTIFSNIPDAGGDFLQGAVALPGSQPRAIALAWHKPGYGVQLLNVPADPVEENWHRRKISETSQDEDLDAGDIDGDGDIDLLLGTKWLRNEGNGGWSVQVLHDDPLKPDRNALVDLNGDGRLDAVIGYEAINVPGKLAWYEQALQPTDRWIEHPIDVIVGPMSLAVVDMDSDGDWDIVVGEHNLKKPESARMLLYENVEIKSNRWQPHLVYQGDEHHDGAHVVDIDNDGDQDILSIGWGHRKVILYENVTNQDQ